MLWGPASQPPFRMSMKNYEFPGEFHRLYRQAVESYAKGQRSSDGLFSPLERDWIAAHGLTTQHLFDYAEDHNNYGGEPGFEHALSIELVRRDYFINVQGGRPSGRILEEAARRTARLVDVRLRRGQKFFQDARPPAGAVPGGGLAALGR